MNPFMAIPNQRPGKFRAGDRVRLFHERTDLVCEILADRGKIGYGGRRLYEVRIPLEEEPIITACGDDDMELIERPAANGKH